MNSSVEFSFIAIRSLGFSFQTLAKQRQPVLLIVVVTGGLALSETSVMVMAHCIYWIM